MAAVAGSETLRWLATLAEWVGVGGRPVDRHGELSRKDVPAAAEAVGVPDLSARPLREVPALTALWDLAIELDVLSLRHARVIPGDTLPTVQAALRREAVPEQALDLWDEVFDELVHPGADTATPEQEKLRDWAQPWTPHLLGNLCREFPDGEFVDAGKLIDGVIAERAGDHPPGGELLDALATSVLLRSLSVLAELGAVEVDAPSQVDEMPRNATAAAQVVGMPLWAVSSPEGLRVRLTSLGQRSVYKRLAGEHTAEKPPVAGAASA
jgi:hypothetical protein